MVSEKLRQYKHDWYMKNRDKALKESAERQKHNPNHMQAVRKWQRKNRGKCAEIQRRYYQNHKTERLEKYRLKRLLEPEKAHAHDVARRIPLADKCEFCPSTEKLQRHHPDYSEPYIIVTACKDCHEVLDQTLFDAGVSGGLPK